jgi:hypothetical protein
MVQFKDLGSKARHLVNPQAVAAVSEHIVVGAGAEPATSITLAGGNVIKVGHKYEDVLSGLGLPPAG